MKPRISESEGLKKAFRRAYLARGGPDSGPFTGRVMSRIRQIGPLGSGPSFWNGLESMVWRLAPVNLILIVPLVILLLSMDFDAGYDYLSTLAGEPERAALSDFMSFEG